MSLPDGSAMPQFKKFVTETEIEERRKKRQEEWDRVRQPNQPLGQFYISIHKTVNWKYSLL